MKNLLKINLSTILAVVLLALVLSNCKKTPDDEPNNDPVAPTATTDTVSFVSQSWGTIGAWIKAGNLLTTISFEYDSDTTQTPFRYKVSADPDTLTGNTLTKRTANLTGLTPNTAYYYRAKAVNSLGETYGVLRVFTTLVVELSDIVFNPDLTYGEISDIEDNVYKTIQIGTQTWMAQNLAVTKYNDGEQIPLAVGNSTWTNDLTGVYSWYGNVEIKYGALYNWYAVNSDKLCPAGWRVPTDDDWTILTDYLGGAEIAGGKLKETDAVHWTSPNVGASNSSGFTALPGGYRYYSGGYNSVKRQGYWWTSSPSDDNPNAGIGRSLDFGYADIDNVSLDKRAGASVRCIEE